MGSVYPGAISHSDSWRYDFVPDDGQFSGGKKSI
jgi:hypothetical protein